MDRIAVGLGQFVACSAIIIAIAGVWLLLSSVVPGFRTRHRVRYWAAIGLAVSLAALLLLSEAGRELMGAAVLGATGACAAWLYRRMQLVDASTSTSRVEQQDLPEIDPSGLPLSAPVDMPAHEQRPHPRAFERNYFVRHWRGELPLVTSYWINGFLVTLLLFATVAVLQYYVSNSSQNESVAVFWIAYWVIALGLTIWQVVGIWRSANNHIACTKRRFWADAAKVVVLLGLVRATVDFLGDGIPAISESLDQAKWLDQNAKWDIRILRDGTEMELSGGIGHGFAEDVGRFLAAAPAVRTVHINLGRGGLLQEAKLANSLMRSRDLTTYTSSNCVSACTIVFLGGKERFLKSGAKLGFHAPTIPGLGKDSSLLIEEKRYLRSMGIKPEFVDKAMSTPHREMWFPTSDELVAAGVVTSTTEGDSFAISGAGRPQSFEKVEAELQSVRIFRALKSKDADAYKKVVVASYEAFRVGKSMDELRSVTLPIIQPIYARSIPYASDASLMRYTNLMVGQLRAVQKQSSKLCVGFMTDTDPNVINAAYRFVPQALRAEELEVMADVLESADETRRIPKDSEVQSTISRALSIAQTQVGADLQELANLQEPNVNANKACRAAIAFYSSIGSLDQKQAAPLLRNLFANK